MLPAFHDHDKLRISTMPACVGIFSFLFFLQSGTDVWWLLQHVSHKHRTVLLNTPMVSGQPPTKTHSTRNVKCGQKPTVAVEADATRSRDGGRWHIRTPTGFDNCLPGRAKRGNAGVHGKTPVHEQHEPAAPWHDNSESSGCATLAPLFKRRSLYYIAARAPFTQTRPHELIQERW